MAHAVHVEINVLTMRGISTHYTFMDTGLQGFRYDELLLSKSRTTPSKDFTDDVLGPGPPYNNDAAKQGKKVQ